MFNLPCLSDSKRYNLVIETYKDYHYTLQAMILRQTEFLHVYTWRKCLRFGCQKRQYIYCILHYCRTNSIDGDRGGCCTCLNHLIGINKHPKQQEPVTTMALAITQGIVGHITITKTMTAFTHLDVEIFLNSLFYVNCFQNRHANSINMGIHLNVDM